jgi:hypothetical protein
MRNTYQIRKYMALALTLALSAGLLAGCTRSDSSKQDSAAGTGNTGVNASGNVVAGAGSTSAQTTQSEPQTAAAPQQETAAAPQQSAASAGTAQNAQNVSGTTTQTPQNNTASSAQTAPAASSSTADKPQQNQSAAVADDDDEGFNGTFEKSDGEEKVQIKVEGSDKIRFVFKTSMINGTAKVKGNIAQYTGDDNYKIIFDISEDVLMVTVDGEDGDLSDMNGIYYRDYGDDETEDEDVVFDGDETEEADEYFDDEDLEDPWEDETE